MGVGGQASASQYLGLLLRMDPQLHGFKVVAWHEPLLQCKVTDQKGDIKMALVSAHTTDQPRDVTGWGTDRRSQQILPLRKALPLAARIPCPKKHPPVP